jgi:APA family basic amino acid/polyamine antiporter
VPWSPLLPILGIVFAVYLMLDLPLDTWIRFVVWLAIGVIIYFTYGYRHSRVRQDALNGIGPNWETDRTRDDGEPR